MAATTKATARHLPTAFAGRGGVFDEDAGKDDVDMEVELGVNLADTFTKKHRNNHNRLESRSLAAWGGSINAFGPEGDSTGLLPAGYWRNGDRQSSWELGLDDVAQESLRKALLEDPDASLLAIDDGILLDLEDPDALRKTAMVEFLYAFEKFRIVYA